MAGKEMSHSCKVAGMIPQLIEIIGDYGVTVNI
jgi:hypothetical protein